MRSVLWGNESNPRGELIENYVFSHSLVIENVGRVPTFIARGAQTCIDVTLSLNLSPYSIEGWKVSSDATFSDHRRVDFSMTLKTDIIGATPNLAQANWQRFREFLNRKQFKDPNFITKRWLDSAVLKLEKYIQKALKIACPMRRGPKKLKRPFYWQGEVEDLKKMAKKAWRTYFRNPNETSWSVYLESRRAFQRGVRRAKQESWRLFTEAPKDSKAMSDLLRHAQGRENKNINLLNDALSDTPEGTLRHLMDVHFPGHSAPVEEGRDNAY